MNLKKEIYRKVVRDIFLKKENEARYIIEKVFFPAIKNKKVLLVGCEEYTKDYPGKLKGNEVYSIDINPHVAKYGVKGKHIIGDVCRLSDFPNMNEFDYIFLIGIFGYGVNDEKTAERTMLECYRTLNNKGILIICWTLGHKIKPEKLINYKLFKEVTFKDIKSGYVTAQKKQFNILEK